MGNKEKFRKAIFLHTQKTAGTTIVTAARSAYGKDSVSHGDFLGRPADQLKAVGFVSGHFGFKYARELLQDRFSFTFLRDPVDRVVSLYFFCRSRDPNEWPIYKLAHDLNIEDFVSTDIDRVQAHIDNHQTSQLFSGWDENGPTTWRDDVDPEELLIGALKHSEQLDFVGFTENSETDIPVVFGELGLERIPNQSICNRTPNRPALCDLTDRERSAIEARVSLDCRLYDELWRRRSCTR